MSSQNAILELHEKLQRGQEHFAKESDDLKTQAAQFREKLESVVSATIASLFLSMDAS